MIVPAMLSVLEDPKLEVRWNAIVALGMYGRRAQSAVPALLEALNDPAMPGQSGMKEQVETALMRIAPEKVGNPVVVEESTPMIAGQTLVEGLDVIYQGERRTMFRPGQAVPSVLQFWDSVPRFPLSLYRQPAAGKEQFLGRFQVTGIPSPPAEVNVAVLLIAAENRVLLSARDNNQNKFLDVIRIGDSSVK